MDSSAILAFLGAVGGTCITGLITLAALRHGELLRRTTRWEPYGQTLWNNRVNIYTELMTLFWDVNITTAILSKSKAKVLDIGHDIIKNLRDVAYTIGYNTAQSKSKEEHHKEAFDKLKRISALLNTMRVISDSMTYEIASNLWSKLSKCLLELKSENDNIESDLKECMVDYWVLLDSVRKELGVANISASTKTVFISHEKL